VGSGVRAKHDYGNVDGNGDGADAPNSTGDDDDAPNVTRRVSSGALKSDDADAEGAEAPPRRRVASGKMVKESFHALDKEYEAAAQVQVEEATAPTAKIRATPARDAFSGPVNMEKQKIAGEQGELYFHNILRAKYREQYRPLEHWVSSNRLACLDTMNRVNVDDGAG
jgi:hypothetical protein